MTGNKQRYERTVKTIHRRGAETQSFIIGKFAFGVFTNIMLFSAPPRLCGENL